MGKALRRVAAQALGVATAFGVATALGACADDKPDDGGASATTNAAPVPLGEDQLEEAVRAYTRDFLAGRGDAAYDRLSTRCQDATARAEFREIARAAAEGYSSASITSLTVSVDGNVGLANYELTDDELNQTDERWVAEQGRWRNDDC